MAHLKDMKSMEAIIFDLDGTLLDSMHFWDNLMFDFIRDKGLSFDSELIRLLPEQTIKETAEYVSDRYPHLGGAQQILSNWQNRAIEAYRTELLLKPGARELVIELASSGKKLAIATMSEHAVVDRVLERHGLDQYFEVVYTVEDVDVGKHQPKIWLEIAKRIGVPPESCIVIEDAYFAAKTAKSAGFFVIGTKDASNAAFADELIRLADQYVDSLSELIGALI